jgi:hypothetical protein
MESCLDSLYFNSFSLKMGEMALSSQFCGSKYTAPGTQYVLSHLLLLSLASMTTLSPSLEASVVTRESKALELILLSISLQEEGD